MLTEWISYLKRRPLALAIVGTFILGGLVMQFGTRAAGPFLAAEPESGNVSSPAGTLSDATASANAAVKFQASAGTSACPAYPSFPDASCTGWQHTGVTLQKVPSEVSSGPGWYWEPAPLSYLKVMDNNTVLDSLDVDGCVYIATDIGATNVTIKRSRITCNGDYLIRVADFEGTYPFKLTDVELVGSAVQQKGNGFTWLRVNAHSFRGKAAMLGTGATVEDSYIHDNSCTPPDHQSGIGTNGAASNIVMRHNNVDLTPSDCTSGGISNYDDFGPFHNVLIEKNLMNSAGYCLKTGFEANNEAGNTSMQVLNNVFGRKYFPECGYWGVQSNWMPSVTGNVWSGNTWGGGAAATSAHNIGDTVDP